MNYSEQALEEAAAGLAGEGSGKIRKAIWELILFAYVILSLVGAVFLNAGLRLRVFQLRLECAIQFFLRRKLELELGNSGSELGILDKGVVRPGVPAEFVQKPSDSKHTGSEFRSDEKIKEGAAK